MPGLLGYWTDTRDTPPPDSLVDNLASTMRHQPGLKKEVRLVPGFAGGRVHLGHLQPEPQPAVDPTGRYLLWLDGEFNNCGDLLERHGLQSMGPHGQGGLALRLFDEAGWAFLPEVDGLFNLALYDRTTHQLTLVNDRYGLRPLYGLRTAQGFAYAGEAKALLCIPDLSIEIDPLAVKEWFSFGYLLGQRTWIRRIEMVPPATIMRVSCDGVVSERYWSWHDIRQKAEPVDEAELVDELRRLWVRAVERRVDHRRLGQLLSGGLDSRAILAAVPATGRHYEALTFGMEDCDDVEIAREVARRKGIAHHFCAIGPENWLRPRVDALWRTDGLGRILALHGAEATQAVSSMCDVLLSGFLGDATVGGSYLGESTTGAYLPARMCISSPLGMDRDRSIEYLRGIYEQDRFPLDRFMVSQRGRRFINTGLTMMSSFVEARLPFFDADFLGFVFGIPDERRRGSHIYNEMLLASFPEYFVDVPWQKTGRPIRSRRRRRGTAAVVRRVERALRSAARRAGIPSPSRRREYVDYGTWLRMEPGLNVLRTWLSAPDALHVNYVEAKAAQQVVDEFLRTGDGQLLTVVGLLLSFELYLRQLFAPASLARDGLFRGAPAGEAPGRGVSG